MQGRDYIRVIQNIDSSSKRAGTVRPGDFIDMREGEYRSWADLDRLGDRQTGWRRGAARHIRVRVLEVIPGSETVIVLGGRTRKRVHASLLYNHVHGENSGWLSIVSQMV